MKYLRKWLFVIPPIMFAMFFILALYSANVAEVSPSAVAIPLFSAMGFALLLLLPAWLIFRNAGKAAIMVSIFLVLLFSYGYVSSAVEGLGVTYKVLWPVWCVLIICSAYLVKRTRRDLHNPTAILSIVAIALVVVPTISIAANEIEAASQGITTTENGYSDGANTSETDSLPDIYYIVLDRYAGESVLREVYDFDNSEFIDYLSSRGFYVASESRSNYPESTQSLASSLNMGYINYLGEELGEDYSDMEPLNAMMQDYEVWRFLKSEGYEFIHMGSWWEPTRKNEYADMNYNYWEIPEFSMTLFKTTMLYPIAQENALLPEWLKAPFIDDFRMGQWYRVQYKFDKLAEIPDMKEPTFVFTHMLIPHNPFVFDRNGNYLTAEEMSNRSVEVNYIDQLVFANGRVRELIDELLSSSEVPPIIILQSDEGSYPGGQDKWIGEGEWEEAAGWEEATPAELREKVTILNAYYLPGVNGDFLYPSITPVNSFRLVFNLYFDTDFELLSDRSYAFYRDHPYKFFDITDVVNCD